MCAHCRAAVVSHAIRCVPFFPVCTLINLQLMPPTETTLKRYRLSCTAAGDSDNVTADLLVCSHLDPRLTADAVGTGDVEVYTTDHGQLQALTRATDRLVSDEASAFSFVCSIAYAACAGCFAHACSNWCRPESRRLCALLRTSLWLTTTQV